MRYVQCTFEHHAEQILDIFNEAIINSTALYDYQARTLDNMVAWFNTKQASNYPVIGALDENDRLLGFASYGIFRNWPAFKYSVEHSVYIHQQHRGKGLGTALMSRLIDTAKAQQYHVMVGGIDAENTASILLHEKLGFAHAGTIKQAGFKFNRWLDLAFFQLILNTPEKPIDG